MGLKQYSEMIYVFDLLLSAIRFQQLILTIGETLLKKHFSTISSKNFQEIISYITDSNILNRLQQILTTSDNNYSNLFTSIDSPYLLDIICAA
ncbi:unnamed protein product [Adineta steineri]|uniref:Uncharacterized protein n=1 Tax=Adineta steineri TaxID=433720 RepID=A0A816AH86_9BILA|nr:unnamed protein product [Adineta steineri]CAF1357008.1 unnamed protein product [Adineta steineri]CAF1594943.1 unnamed protein product [Adineta steineri]CAF1599042.1 unnamed protein product [Adineta steineri]